MADLLLDEGIGRDLAEQLRGQGYRAFHVLEFLPKGVRDSLVFLEAQRRALTLLTWNRVDYTLLVNAWQDWGHGDFHGIISRRPGQPQLAPAQLLPVVEAYCRDTSPFLNRIELF
ncbi:MAG TPA: DUF5615 family PIN-like protein [Ktedonobacterales bacterium]|nr:DUF5615 family PIN-like protein [Ktedonobacterales bacterium]